MTSPRLHLGCTLAGLVAAVVFSAAAAQATEAGPLALQTEQESPRAGWLLDPDSAAVPPSLQGMMLDQVGDELNQNLDAFSQSLTDEAEAGGGDGEYGAMIVLAGILGFIPGFGIGHLITGHVGGFVLWLIIDLVLAGVFFGVFPFLAFAFWYVPGVIVYVGERIVEAIFAANAARRPIIVEAAPPHDGPGPVQAAIPVLTF